MVAVVFTGSACGDDEGGGGGGDAGVTSPDAGGADSGSQATGSLDIGVVTFAGDAVANATVFVRGTTISATTDAMGVATLSDVPVGDVVVTARADGGIEVHAPATVVADQAASVVLNSPAVQSTTVTPSATTDTEVTLAGVSVTLPAGASLSLPDGSTYSGDIDVRVAPLLNDNVLPVPLPTQTDESGAEYESGAMVMFDVSMFSAGGDALQLAANNTVNVRQEVSFDADTLAAVAGLDNKIPLLRYDPETAAWVDAGILTYADGVVTGTLSHLSIYGGFGSAFYRFTYSYPTTCQKGRIMDGTQGRKAIILVETKVFTRGGAIINRRGVATDADGNFCIEVPPAGAMSMIEQWDVRNPTRRTYSLPVRLRAVRVDGRYIATPAAPASTFDMMCASGASCDDVGTIQHPLSVNPKPPTCASNASICDDANSCTTDSCDSTTLCPAGTSCSGCSNAASTGACDDGNTCTSGDTCGGGICTGTASPAVGVASGFTSPPTLAISTAAMTGVTFEDSFAAAPSNVMWNTPIQVNGGTAMSMGGRLIITDTDPADTNGPTQFNMDAPSDRVGRLSGAGWIDLAFVLPAAGNDAASNIDLSMQDSMAAVSARLARRAPTGDAFELQIDGGASPATVTLPAGVVHTLRIERDAAGVVSTTLTPNGGSPVSISGGTLVAADPWGLSLQLSSNTIAGQTGNVAIFEIDSVTSNVTFDLAAQWALSNSPLSYNGNDYTDADPGTGTKGVLWLGALTKDGIDTAWEDGVMTPIDFDGTAASIRAYAVTVTMGAMSFRTTIYSELDETTLRAALTGLGIMTFTVDATIDVFTRQADGTYAASLISCP